MCVCVCCESVYTRVFLCDAGVSAVLSAGCRPGGSVGGLSLREQMVNGCVTRCIDFVTVVGPFCSGDTVKCVAWLNVLIPLVRFHTDRKAQLARLIFKAFCLTGLMWSKGKYDG